MSTRLASIDRSFPGPDAITLVKHYRVKTKADANGSKAAETIQYVENFF